VRDLGEEISRINILYSLDNLEINRKNYKKYGEWSLDFKKIPKLGD
jgi:hypothetical protein